MELLERGLRWVLDQRRHGHIHPGMHGQGLQVFMQFLKAVRVLDRKICALAHNSEQAAQLARLDHFVAARIFRLADRIKLVGRPVARQPHHHPPSEP